MKKKSAEKPIKKVVLAYSGGLDTSVILKWLQDTYQCEVVTFVDAVYPFPDEHPAVRGFVLAMAVRLAFLPLSFVPTAVRRVVAAVAILQAVLPFAGIAPAFRAGKRAFAFRPAFL